jgi:hypothetical protein
VCPESKSPQYHLLTVLGGPKSQSRHCGEEKIFCLFRESKRDLRAVTQREGGVTVPSCVSMFKLSARTAKQKQYSSVFTRFSETQTPGGSTQSVYFDTGTFVNVLNRRWAGPCTRSTGLRQPPLCLIYYLRYFRRSLQRKEERQTWNSCLSVCDLLCDA